MELDSSDLLGDDDIRCSAALVFNLSLYAAFCFIYDFMLHGVT